MAYKDVETFVRAHAKSKALQRLFEMDPDKALEKYSGLSDDEKALIKRKNAMEIRSYLKDSYGASLSINIP